MKPDLSNKCNYQICNLILFPFTSSVFSLKSIPTLRQGKTRFVPAYINFKQDIKRLGHTYTRDGAANADVLTDCRYMRLSNFVVHELTEQTRFTNATVTTQKHLEEVIVVFGHLLAVSGLSRGSVLLASGTVFKS